MIVSKTKLAVSVAVIVAIVVSCTKDRYVDTRVMDTGFSDESLVQFYVATVNATRNYAYVNGVPLNGATMASGAVAPATGHAFRVPIGLRAFLVKDTLASSPQVPLSFSENLGAGNRYTVFLYDTTTAPKQKTVPTNIEVPTDTTSRIRFAYFTYNPVAQVPALDVYSVKQARNIFTNVSFTEVTGYVPIASELTDTFYIRPTGTTTNLQNFTPTPAPGTWNDIRGVLTPTEKRSYTLVFRGSFRTTATNSTHVRQLSTFINY